MKNIDKQELEEFGIYLMSGDHIYTITNNRELCEYVKKEAERYTEIYLKPKSDEYRGICKEHDWVILSEDKIQCTKCSGIREGTSKDRTIIESKKLNSGLTVQDPSTYAKYSATKETYFPQPNKYIDIVPLAKEAWDKVVTQPENHNLTEQTFWMAGWMNCYKYINQK